MATIRAYTDLDQSKKLAEILPLESADMIYFGIHQGMDGKYYLSGTNTEDDVVPIYKNFCIKVFAKTTASDVVNQLPCWSLATLLGVLPYCPDLSKHTDGKWYITTYPNDVHTCLMAYDNPIDACYEMIMRLHELKML